MQIKFLIIIVLILLLYVSLGFVSTKIPTNSLYVCGEYQSTLSLPSHLDVLRSNIDFTNPNTLFSCPGCALFYPYSMLYSLSYFTYLSLGSYLNINTFLFYVSSGIVIQLLSIILFFKFGLGKEKLNWLGIALTASIFIFPVYKTQLLCSGTSYALNHSITLLFITYLIYIFRKIKDFDARKLVSFGLLGTLLLALIILLGINYVPILIYTGLILCVFHIKSIRMNLRKIIMLATITLSIFIIANLKWIVNLGNYEFQKNFLAPANNETFLDAFTGRYFVTVSTPEILPVLFALFLFITIIVNFYLKTPHIKKLTATYLFIIMILMGNNLFINLYGFIFDNFPLMSSIRSSHRFYVFIFTIQIILIYNLIEKLKGKLKRIYVVCLVTIIVLTGISTINQAKEQYVNLQIPTDYPQVEQYIKQNLKGKTVLYLPFNNNQYLYGKYNWYELTKQNHNPYVYLDVAQSIFYIDDLIQIFNWYHYGPEEYHLNRLKNYYLTINSDKIFPTDTQIRNLNPDIILVDRNAKVLQNEYDFELSNYTKDREFGRITVYQRDSEIKCQKYYGNIITKIDGYCFDNYNPDLLNEKDRYEFIYENITKTNWQKASIFKSPQILKKMISSQDARDYLVNKQIIFNTDTVELLNPNPTDEFLFSNTQINADMKYLLFEAVNIPIDNENPSEIIVSTSDKQEIVKITEISKMKLYIIPINITNTDQVKITLRGSYALISTPYFLTQLDYTDFEIQALNVKLNETLKETNDN